MKFSQRIGKTPQTKQIQLEFIDSELRNSLWNAIQLFIIDEISPYTHDGQSIFENFCKWLWYRFYKKTVNTIPYELYKKISAIREAFLTAEWYDAYDLIEFLSSSSDFGYDNQVFMEEVNAILEREFSAYRFINGHLVPISNSVEIDEIEHALGYTPFPGANIHLANAIEKLASKTNPDFRNSIKESISAVESACRTLTGESTLGKALKTLELKGVEIDDQLKTGFEKIYAYTNNKQSGIRHAIIEAHRNPDFNDAKYMLVACSSFINYLVGKSEIRAAQ